ncbi:MAG: rRNA adenine dimethyltransferase family protein [Microgenomates group bacterium]
MVYHDKNSLGQNFIKYRGLVSELIAAADLKKEDLVIEIGSGKNIITNELRKVVDNVIAIEKDPELAQKYGAICIDFLDYELPKEKYKIFANIPFSITAEIMNKILTSPNLPEEMYLIMQKETAEKFAGIPHETKSSILTKPWFEIEVLGQIDRTNFTLKPQIKIVFVKFVKRQSAFIKDEDKIFFRHFVNYGFAAWAPTVMESYKKVLTYDQRKNIQKMLKIGEVKPTELSFDKWLLLYKSCQKILGESQRKLIRRPTSIGSNNRAIDQTRIGRGQK